MSLTKSLSLKPEIPKIRGNDRRSATRIEDIDPLTAFKLQRDYRSLWVKAIKKVVATLRMKRIITDIKLYGQSSTLFNESRISQDQLMNYLTQKSKALNESTVLTEKNYISKTVFNPNGTFISVWNVIMAVILLYTAIVDPFVLSYLNTTVWDTLFIIGVVFDMAFLLDMIFTFNTAYYDEDNQIIGTRKKIALKYLKSWFILDISSSVPFSLLEAFVLPTGNNATRLVRITRLRNIPKLMRLSRLVKIAKNLSYLQDIDFIISMNQRLLRFLKVIMMIILCLHVSACLWHLTAKMDNFSPDTWVVRFGYIDSDHWNKYLTSLYWALTTLTTLGYGDIFPLTVPEKVFAMMWMLFAVYFLSFSIGSLTTMFAEMDSRDRIINEKLLLVDEFFHATQLSVDIMHKLKRSIRLSTDIVTFDLQDKDALFEKLPVNLKFDLAKSMYAGSIGKFSFFTMRDEVFQASVAVYLESYNFSPDQNIWTTGEPSTGIYFIVSGKINYVFGANNLPFRSLSPGEYFGDVEIINQEVRRFSVKSLTQSFCLVLPKPIVVRIQSQFPSVWKDIVEVVKDREEKIYINLAEMTVLQEMNRKNKIKHFDKTEVNQKINEEYNRLVEEAKNSKKSKKQKQIELIETQIKKNLDSIQKLEQKLVTIVQSKNKNK